MEVAILDEEWRPNCTARSSSTPRHTAVGRWRTEKDGTDPIVPRSLDRLRHLPHPLADSQHRRVQLHAPRGATACIQSPFGPGAMGSWASRGARLAYPHIRRERSGSSSCEEAGSVRGDADECRVVHFIKEDKKDAMRRATHEA